MSPKPILVVIAGPTGVGKTALAIDFAHAFQGEIVNADSRSFYRGMDIGTAKPSPEERAAAPHHLIDILDPNDEMSLSTFQHLAFDAIDDIVNRDRLPLLVGGTAQYLHAIIENWKIPEVAPQPEFRATMEDRVDREGVTGLMQELERIGPGSLARTGPNPRRIIRALEVHHVTGRPMSELIGKNEPRYHALLFELWLPREMLHERIAQRVDLQLQRGLVQEVQQLLDRGYDPALPAMSSIGYREVIPYLQGTTTIEETRAAIVANSNRLVRHQQTWFRKNPDVIRIDLTQPDAITSITNRIALGVSENKSY